MKIFHHPDEKNCLALLGACDLPTSDLEPHHFDHFLGCGTADELLGIIGVEIFSSVALLRSLAVAEKARGTGCGKALVTAIENYARERNIQELYLLTTTAKDFFIHLGYSIADRNAAPDDIRHTREFSGICPGSAIFMVKLI